MQDDAKLIERLRAATKMRALAPVAVGKDDPETVGRIAKPLCDEIGLLRELISQAADRLSTPPHDRATREGFSPCPTCHQYSHSIGDDKLADAFNHFQSMFSHRGDGIPTQFNFGEQTRDAAQVLMAAADRGGIRREAFEEAAKVARAVFAANPGTRRFASGSRAVAAGIEAAILALKETPA